jgi:hypothetical protein
MTDKAARDIVRALRSDDFTWGFTLTKKDGVYRLAEKHGDLADDVYFSLDLDAVVQTAKARTAGEGDYTLRDNGTKSFTDRGIAR